MLANLIYGVKGIKILDELSLKIIVKVALVDRPKALNISFRYFKFEARRQGT